MWISMLGIISRYDGYRFKTYSSSRLNMPESGACKYIAVDKENRIWYAGGDVYKKRFYSGVIDTRIDSVYTMEAISGGRFTSKDVTYLDNVDTNTISIATRTGVVYTYDGNFNEIYRSSDDFTWHFDCKAMPDGSYWIYDRGEFIHVKNGKRLKTIAKSFEAVGIIKNQPGLVLYTPYNTTSSYWKLNKNIVAPYDLRGLPGGTNIMPLQIHDHYTSYAAQDTIFIKDTSGRLLYRFTISKAMKTGQRVGWQNSYTDRQNTLWIATGNGLLKITSRKNPFKTLMPGRSVRGIYRKGEQLWVGSHGKNSVINNATGTEKEFWFHNSAAVSSFQANDKGELWMTAMGASIIKYSSADDTYIPHYFNNSLLNLSLIFQNKVTRNYWLGGENGIFRFDIKNKVLKPDPENEYIKNNVDFLKLNPQKFVIIDKDEFLKPLALPIPSENIYVRQFYQNNEGIWIVTNKGLFLMDNKKEIILKHYTAANGLPFHNLNHLYEDSNGIFWIGTKGEGLIRWDRQNNSFQQFTRNDGLSNNNIYAVYEDDYQTLWLPSDHGLMAFDKTTKTTRVYLPQNGIAHEEFNTHAHFKGEDGTLYFGGLNGITKFHPKDLQQQDVSAQPLHASGARILQQDAEIFTDVFSAYKTTQKIKLEPGDHILELDLTLLDYEKSEENQYAYKISKKQEQWIYTTDNKISIINPPYGKYDVIIKARGASGQWSEDQLRIPLYVRAPFYLQWWFFLSVVAIVTVSVIVMVRWRIRKLQKDREHLEEEVQRRTHRIEQDKIIIEKDKQTIEQQAEELKVLDEAKSRFFANITHEFRTPLTLVTGPLEQIIEKSPPSHLKKGLNGVLKNAKQLLGLINQLLDISKLEGNKMQIEYAHGNIMNYTSELVSQFRAMAQRKEIVLSIKTLPDRWETHFDTDKWQKIINNLLSNALKFTPQGGTVSLLLEQVFENKREFIQLIVKDNGIGIPGENLNHVFDRFYQADASSTRAQKGTGIGLALVKELVALQKGSITAESAPGKGTTFIIKLPVLIPETGEEQIPLSSPDTETLPVLEETAPNGEDSLLIPESGKLQLLIIEDNTEMRAYIRSCMDESTYQIAEAPDGAEGIVIAQETVPDLIISDVMMPKKDGFEVTKAIRNHVATSHIPLILLTAKASLESRLKGLQRGADAYLTKPFSPQELALRIQKLIELRQLLQQRYQGQQPTEDNTASFKKEDRFIADLNTYINNNITEPELDIDAISRYFSLSQRQFYRKLKALKNNSPANYIRTLRLDKAVQLIKEQQLNISEIAYETGFSSPSHFSRTFKKVYGKAPSEWS